MTPKHVVHFDVMEIPALELRCRCGSMITLPLPKHNLPETLQCAGCNAPLWAWTDDPVRSLVTGIVRSISAWKELKPQPKFSIGFSLESADRAFGVDRGADV